MRLLDQEGRTELGSLVAGYSSDYQVVRHLFPPIPINLATTSLLMDCTSPHCSALLTVHPDPGVVSCTSLAGSGQDKIKTQCLTSSQVRHLKMINDDAKRLFAFFPAHAITCEYKEDVADRTFETSSRSSLPEYFHILVLLSACVLFAIMFFCLKNTTC